jgi:hypothetical protein
MTQIGRTTILILAADGIAPLNPADYHAVVLPDHLPACVTRIIEVVAEGLHARRAL